MMLQRTCKKVSIDFLIMLSPTMNTNVLDFWGTVGFWDLGGGLSLTFFLISFIFHDVTPGLVKCVVSSGSASITLSTCTSFTLLFCFANFVNWRSLSDWMGYEVMELQVSRRSSFISEMLSSFRLSHGLLLLHSHEFCLSSVPMTFFFSFTPILKKANFPHKWRNLIVQTAIKFTKVSFFFCLIKMLLLSFPQNRLLQLYFGCFVIIFIDVIFKFRDGRCFTNTVSVFYRCGKKAEVYWYLFIDVL